MPDSLSVSLSKLELRCPPMPETLMEALVLSKNPEQIDPTSVTKMLRKDPLAVAWLLRMANSSLHGLRRAISSPEHAVVMLGSMQVIGLVVGMSMLKLRSALSGPAGPSFNRLIRHSVATAHLSRFLIEELPAQHGASNPNGYLKGIGFTAGLLHDFGKIVLVYNFPDKAVPLYDHYGLSQDDVAALQERERLLFGCDHTEAGVFAANKLDFPDALAQAIHFHHRPEQLAGDVGIKHLVAATTLADLGARAMGHAFTSPCSQEMCATDPAWAYYLPFAPSAIDTPEALIEAVFGERENLDPQVQSFTPSMAA